MTMNKAACAAAVVAAVAGSASAQTGYEDLGDFLGAAPYATNLIDFEAYASGTQIMSLPGITSVEGFSVHGGPTVDVRVTSQNALPFPMFSGNTSSPVNFLSTDLTIASGTGTIAFTFAEAQNAIGLFVADGSALDLFNITLYAGAVEVASVDSMTFRNLPDSFFGVVSPAAFDRAVVGSLNPNDSWGLDDLRFGAIPAPGSLAALAAGVLVAGRRRRVA